MITIVAIDPGNVCGMAEARFREGEVEYFQSWETGPIDCVRCVEESSFVDRIHVVYETFTPRPGVYTWQPEALYTIGAIRYVATKRHLPFSEQSPADAKKFSTNDKLAVLGWRSPSKGGHQDDAARHLLLCAVKMNALDLGVLL